jgi:hypothetical protein
MFPLIHFHRQLVNDEPHAFCNVKWLQSLQGAKEYDRRDWALMTKSYGVRADVRGIFCRSQLRSVKRRFADVGRLADD